MIDELSIEPFLNLVNFDDIRVHQPSSIFLVCGGEQDVKKLHPCSLRDAYLRFCITEEFDKHTPLLAEDLTKVYERANYNDILSFESDIAHICSLVILFSESYGSAAELGAFSITKPIAKKLFVVIDDKNFEDNSFVKLGPLRHLQMTQGEESVCVLNRKDVAINEIDNLENIDKKFFIEILTKSLKGRLEKIDKHSTFDSSQNGHIIKLLVGIIQWYGALTLIEISICLSYFKIPISEQAIENFLLCAEMVGWLKKDKRGITTYYTAIAKKMAVQFSFNNLNGKPFNGTRWRNEVRQEWSTKDILRFRSIVDAQVGN